MTLLYIRGPRSGPSGYTRDDVPVLSELTVSCKNSNNAKEITNLT
jgi:hypothetical protein